MGNPNNSLVKTHAILSAIMQQPWTEDAPVALTPRQRIASDGTMVLAPLSAQEFELRQRIDASRQVMYQSFGSSGLDMKNVNLRRFMHHLTPLATYAHCPEVSSVFFSLVAARLAYVSGYVGKHAAREALREDRYELMKHGAKIYRVRSAKLLERVQHASRTPESERIVKVMQTVVMAANADIAMTYKPEQPWSVAEIDRICRASTSRRINAWMLSCGFEPIN